jgi:hypothetical protein
MKGHTFEQVPHRQIKVLGKPLEDLQQSFLFIARCRWWLAWRR